MINIKKYITLSHYMTGRRGGRSGLFQLYNNWSKMWLKTWLVPDFQLLSLARNYKALLKHSSNCGTLQHFVLTVNISKHCAFAGLLNAKTNNILNNSGGSKPFPLLSHQLLP